MSKLLGAFASLVSKPVAKAAIILLFAGMAAAGAYGLSQIAVGIPFQYLCWHICHVLWVRSPRRAVAETV